MGTDTKASSQRLAGVALREPRKLVSCADDVRATARPGSVRVMVVRVVTVFI